MQQIQAQPNRHVQHRQAQHRQPQPAHSNTVRMELPKMKVKARTTEEKVSQVWVTSICGKIGAG